MRTLWARCDLAVIVRLLRSSCLFSGRLFGGQAVDEDAALGGEILGEIDEALMVREENDLRLCCDLGEDLEGSAGAGVVEADEDVVDNERQGLVLTPSLLQGREAEGEVELVAAALAHALDGDLLALRSDT